MANPPNRMNKKVPPKQKAGKQGASVSKVKLGDTVKAWRFHHVASAKSSLQKLLATPVQSLMTWLVIAVALALPAGFLIVIHNIEGVSDGWQGDPQLTVYLQAGLSQDAIDEVGEKMKALANVKDITYISPEQGMEELKEYGGMGDAINTLDENPLPPVYLLTPLKAEELAIQVLSAEVGQIKTVDSVQVDLEWVARMQHLLTLAERGVLLLGAFLALGVFLTIGNTIRLAIENRRDEIVIIKLVGGTDAYVRRPLLYSGIWYGLVGGLLAWVLLLFATLLLAPVVSDLLTSYGSDFSASGAGLITVLQLSFIGALLGYAGAWLAVARHLKDIQPR